VVGPGGWSLVAEARGDDVRLRYDGPEDRVGPWVSSSTVDGPLEVALDRVNHELTVGRGDRVVLQAWLVDLTGPVRAPAGQVTQPAATPLCDDLAARLDG